MEAIIRAYDFSVTVLMILSNKSASWWNWSYVLYLILAPLGFLAFLSRLSQKFCQRFCEYMICYKWRNIYSPFDKVSVSSFFHIHICVCIANKNKSERLDFTCNCNACDQLTSFIKTILITMCCRQMWKFFALRYDLDNEVKEDEIGNVCSTQGKVGNTYKICFENLKLGQIFET